MERLWLLMRRLQGQGIHVIVGDIVLDRSASIWPGMTRRSLMASPASLQR